MARPDTYIGILAPLTASIDIWETVYWHVLAGNAPVLAWARGTVLRPLLDAYGAGVDAAYPASGNGTTLFPFRRLFIVAGREPSGRKTGGRA
ncbi:MAG: hypothetical protein ACFCUO_02560 [Rhodospirillales bacterium]